MRAERPRVEYSDHKGGNMRQSLIEQFKSKVDAGSCCYEDWYLNDRTAGAAVDALVEWLRENEPVFYQRFTDVERLADMLEAEQPDE